MKVFLDMDGVLIDLVAQITKEFGYQTDPWPIPGEWEFGKVFNINEDDIWDNVFYNFWVNAPKTSFADRLVELVSPGNEVFICTSPKYHGDCFEGKLDCIKQYYPHLHKRVVFTKSKEACAGPGSVLIDDSDHNCEAFTKLGGTSLLVPSPWNKEHKLADNAWAVIKSKWNIINSKTLGEK